MAPSVASLDPGKQLGALSNGTPNWSADPRLQQRLALLNTTGRHITNLTFVNGTTYVDVDEDAVSPGFAIVLMYLLLLLILGAQTGLVVWKKKHKRSYELVTLLGLWMMPAIFSLHLKFWRFLLVWGAFSGVSLHLLYLCAGKKKVDQRTPRKVYTFFLAAYQVAWTLGVAGYILLILDLFGIGLLLAAIGLPPGTSFVLLWYGLYFGILGRDCAEVMADQMAAGLNGRLSSTAHACGICAGELKDYSHLGESAEGAEPVRQLSCKHSFHELCVRGWTIVGKKDVCPVCNEKVDLRHLYSDRPWETQNLSWLQMLDAIRYMVVYNPMIFLVFSLFAHLAPHHTIHRHIALATGLAGAPPGAAGAAGSAAAAAMMAGAAGVPPAAATRAF
ncbi:MAG: hypothetical protein J3K34DRAFT_460175 [Monoraphidium minutum]|nr:MAG: hypothetical protein J3K34DRAFT_460175 [Monoraphidium minutum]